MPQIESVMICVILRTNESAMDLVTMQTNELVMISVILQTIELVTDQGSLQTKTTSIEIHLATKNGIPQMEVTKVHLEKGDLQIMPITETSTAIFKEISTDMLGEIIK